ncbi:MAG: ATP-binding protein [Pseudomonadota bacterium]
MSKRGRKAVRARSQQGSESSALSLDALLGALPHPILVIAPGNAIALANPAAEIFFDVSVSVLRRQSLDDLLTFGCPLLSLLEQVRRNSASVNEYGVEIAVPRAGGTKLVDVYAGLLPECPDQIFLLLQQRSMAQMIERQLTHRAAARSVSGLASMLAHEIKNPLSGIRGAAQLIESSLAEGDRQLVQLICAETDRIRDLVDRMEVFGDDRPLPPTPINIHDVLDHVRQIASNGFAQDATIVAAYDPSLPPITGHRDSLIQAYLNLVKNAAEAVKETGKRGRITLRTGFRPGIKFSLPGAGQRVALPLVVEIEDNGPGVPEELRPHLFDPFVTTKRSGTGLGLALVAKIIGDHGGVIEYETQAGHTTFRTLMPMHQPMD